MNSLVIDASVVLKWYIPDEEIECADRIKRDFLDKRILLSAPSIIHYEINNVVLNAVRSKRLSVNRATLALKDFYFSDIKFHSSSLLLLSTFKLAEEFNISSYDASYVALSQSARIPFYTADAKLIGKLKNKIPLVKSLSEYPN